MTIDGGHRGQHQTGSPHSTSPDPLRNGQAHLCTIVHKLTVRSRCRPPLHAGRCEAHCVLTVNVLGAVWNCQAAAVSVRRRGPCGMPTR